MVLSLIFLGSKKEKSQQRNRLPECPFRALFGDKNENLEREIKVFPFLILVFSKQ